IAFEVGMQNGGLASGLALQMGKVATVGLAPAIFGPLMNVTGSVLANYWRGKPVKGEEEVKSQKSKVRRALSSPPWRGEGWVKSKSEVKSNKL
ncbi:MAG: hypothetical protein V1775_01710, partial [Bacteroidota bacterium]